MAHESDGAILHWTHRTLLCWFCGQEYDHIYGTDDDCPDCGPTMYDILEEYYT